MKHCYCVGIFLSSTHVVHDGRFITVVVDRRENKDCDTGGFELVYKQVSEEPRVRLAAHS